MTFFGKIPEKTTLKVGGLPVFGILAVFGGFLIQFTMGAFYSFGNISTYMSSYMRQNGSPNITSADFVTVQSTWGMTQGVVMPLSGFLIARIGNKLSMVAGTFLFSLGCALTTITINKELWMVAATYGFVSAFGQNIALIPTLTSAMKWFPNHKGTAMGIVVGGFGGGSFVFTQIQTQYINPENFKPERIGPNKGYFTEPILLERLPDLLLLLSGIYLVMGLVGALLILQPPNDWFDEIDTKEDPTDYISWKEALKTKEFYILWMTRLCAVLITQVIGGFYKTFGQEFIFDDHYLALVGAISSIFNCSGRLFYGFIMDKSSYKMSMSIESLLLTVLMSTIYVSSLFGVKNDFESPKELCKIFLDFNETIPLTMVSNFTGYAQDNGLNGTTLDVFKSRCSFPETPFMAKAAFAVWVWAIYFTFPGTYSTQPAVTTQTFGHRHGGRIYSFLFSSDIINNLMVATLSNKMLESYGYLGLFMSVSSAGIVAFIITQLYPQNPSPKTIRFKSDDINLKEI
ncbi:apicoplast pyruvate carrier 1 [Lepeophtheirus salmonis]|uniref:apicoplast pyruvate carrier 1 n=1 Tax=Lepeophtheirus salmonis TaxID=72036 RepID=UPI001AE4454B|nr:uncharacterized protein LOC121123929 [Lepeophtheirus salmonis]XP_040574923.1 uncharacterized protein LOC121123929 [Lepeophtheirus salmonis]